MSSEVDSILHCDSGIKGGLQKLIKSDLVQVACSVANRWLAESKNFSNQNFKSTRADTAI